jgi:CubicO group peptidase (beta-lactamase class C family)
MTGLEESIQAALRVHGTPRTPDVDDIGAYLARQVSDTSHREVLGPLLPAGDASGGVWQGGELVVCWGDPSRPEMLFSATKSVIAAVAGIAYDDGLLDPAALVEDAVPLSPLRTPLPPGVTWGHMLQQTTMWEGELWGKPTRVDAQSRREGTEATEGAPGTGWAYNDVRVNLICLALTELFQRPLPDVLAERVMSRIGASSSWSWHGYGVHTPAADGQALDVVSGGAHWGGGVFMSANDLAALGQLIVDGGRDVLSQDWIRRMWTPCPVKPAYGYLWWLNDSGDVLPLAPETGRLARGNGGRHILWVDPERDLVIASHWTEDIEKLIRLVSACVDDVQM